MALAPDNHMVVDCHAQQPPRFGDFAGHLNIGAAGLGIARGVVVHQYQRARADIHRFADHLARVDCRLIDGSIAHMVIIDQSVLGIQIQDPHPLDS